MHGEFTIIKRKAELVDGEWVAGEIIDVFDPVRNKLCQPLYHNMYNVTDNGGNRTDIGILSVNEAIHNNAYGAKLHTSDGWIGGTVANTGTWNPKAGMDDPYFELQTTINPPATVTRNIRTIAFGATGTSASAFSVVPLANSCPQTTSEILQINYRVILDISEILANSNIGERAATENFRETAIPTAANSLDDGQYLYNHMYLLDFDNNVWGKGVTEGAAGCTMATSAFTEIYYGIIQTAVTYRVQGFKRGSIIAQFGKNNSPTSNDYQTGAAIKGVGLGRLASLLQVADIGKGTTSSVQNTFGRTASIGTDARPPFLDNNIIATSAASINIQDIGDWVGYNEDGERMPHLYRITMETGGLVGASTYKIQKRKFCTWYGNSSLWIGQGISMPTMSAYPVASVFVPGETVPADSNLELVRHGQAWWRGGGTLNATDGGAGLLAQRYVYPEVITWDYTGLTITDIHADYVNIDANSTPALNVTEVLQVGTDGTDILVACAATGLWLVQREVGDFTGTAHTVTQLSPPGITDTTSCRGVFPKGRPHDFGGVKHIRVVQGGSNYAVGNTVVIAGANGTSATAEVFSVDGVGAITAVRVTAKGSGYFDDNVSAYVSTAGGVGAKFEIEITASDGHWFALFDDETDNFMYLAESTRVGSNDYTSGITFATAGDTITRTDGTSFLSDGFRVDQKLFIKDAEDAANNGIFTITAVSATVITVSENLTNSTGADTTAWIEGMKWEIMTETITDDSSDLTFADANPDTIFRNAGTSFITQGFREGMEIIVSAATVSGNDGIWTIKSVTADTITVDSEQALSASTNDVTAVLSTLTDFTITNYTGAGDSPGRTGFIGMVMDPSHADDRFVMLTPTAKSPNDGNQTQPATSGFDWWSKASSTISFSSFNTSSGVDGGTEIITTDATHDFGAGNAVTYSKDGGTEAVGLTDSTVYYINVLSPTTLSIHTTRSNALTDTSRINLTSAAAETHLLTADQGSDQGRTATTAHNQVLSGEQIATLGIWCLDDDSSWVTTQWSDPADGLWYDWRQTGSFSYSSGEGNRGRAILMKNKDVPPVDTTSAIGSGVAGAIRSVKNRSESTPNSLFDTVLAGTTTGGTSGETYVGITSSYAYASMGRGIMLGWQGSNSQGPWGWQVFTHNGNGTLDAEAALPYGFWEEYGWDGTRWVLGNASAKTTHSAATFTGTELTFTAAAGTIVGGGTWAATDWATDGFNVGDHITVASSEDAANNGVYTIEQLSTVTLTVTPDRLPGIDSSAAPDTTATVTGSTALIDGLSIEFDDNGAADAFVLDEYYDTHLYDGILKDNATTATFNADFFILASESGTDYSSGTVPAAPGAVTDIPFGACNHGDWTSSYFYSEPGVAASPLGGSGNIVLKGEMLMTGDFQMRFRVTGATDLADCYVGITPWSVVTTGVDSATSLVDQNMKIVYDFVNFPTLNEYDIEFRDTGSGGVLSTYNADRVMLDITQDYLNFDDTGSNGDWEAGSGHADDDVLTMDDGSTITVLTHSGGQILTWEITTQATATSGRTERIIGANDWTSGLAFNDNGGSPDTIVRTDGTDFVADGFLPGMKIWVRNANTAANDGNYTIATVSTTTLTLIASDVLTTDGAAAATMSTAITQTLSDGSGVDFAFTLGTANEVDSELGNDLFYFDRTGTGAGTMTAGLNGVEIYNWSATNDLDVAPSANSATSSGGGFTVYDYVLDYTDNRRTVLIGNGTSTGGKDPNFLNFPYLEADRAITVFLDGVAATLLTDGFTSPAVGEANILMGSGRLWFNDADAGKTITGTWVHSLRFNIT